MASSSHARRRAVALLLVAVALGVGAALALRHRSSAVPPVAAAPAGPAAGQRGDPLRYTAARRADFERRAARGLAHPLFAFSPGGAVATAARVGALRPLVARAARAGGVDPDTLEGMVLLESAGRPDAQAGTDLSGAVGLTQILAETGRDLLGLRVDVARSTRLTRGIRRGHRVAERERERRRVDERFDAAKALAATVRYLRFARGKLGGRTDLAVESYHMGVGNLQGVLGRFGAGDVPYAELFFTASPLVRPAAQAKLAGFGDDSATYLWRVRAAESIMRRWRQDPAALAAEAVLQGHKNSAEEVLHPEATTQRWADPAALEHAEADGDAIPLDPRTLRASGIRIDPRMGELADQLDQPRSRYRALRPGALRLLEYLGGGVRALSGVRTPLVLTSTARDERYQALLVRRNVEATHAYSLHTTGWAFDVERSYASRNQALAFQYLLDRLTALDLIAWVREPAAIHVTVAGDADRLLRR